MTLQKRHKQAIFGVAAVIVVLVPFSLAIISGWVGWGLVGVFIGLVVIVMVGWMFFEI